MSDCPIGQLVPLVVQMDLIIFISLFTNESNKKLPRHENVKIMQSGTKSGETSKASGICELHVQKYLDWRYTTETH